MNEVKQLGNSMVTGKRENPNQGRVYDSEGIAPSLTTMQGGGREPMIIEQKPLTNVDNSEGLISTAQHSTAQHSTAQHSTAQHSTAQIRVCQATSEGSIEMDVPGIADLTFPNSQTRRGRVQERGQICPTLTTENIPSVIEPWIWEIDGVKYLIRIRKLTPRECWRLMGFLDEDYDKASEVNSNTQLYKQAGNSIVVDVLEHLFKQFF